MRRLLALLNRPAPGFVFDLKPQGFAVPHVEGDGPIFDWVIAERGQELERRSVDAEELLFLTMESMTCAMAQAEELRTRSAARRNLFRHLVRTPRASSDDDYSRATWIDAHVRLMTRLRTHWGPRVQRRYDDILRRFPLTPAERANRRRMDLADFGVD